MNEILWPETIAAIITALILLVALVKFKCMIY